MVMWRSACLEFQKDTNKYFVLEEEKELQKKIDKLSKEKDISVNIEKLHVRAELYTNVQNQSKAINDYVAILKINPEDKIAQVKLDMLRTIVKFTNTDIYANPNTNLDPWLE